MPSQIIIQGLLFEYVGNPDLITNHKIAIFCSNHCQASVILKTLDEIVRLRDAEATILSGFQSPLEKECLLTLLRGNSPVIIFPARSIINMRIPPNWKQALNSGRMLIISNFSDKVRRPDKASSRIRNEIIANLADEVIMAKSIGSSHLNEIEESVDGRKIPTTFFQT